jgi:hypothetical protein
MSSGSHGYCKPGSPDVAARKVKVLQECFEKPISPSQLYGRCLTDTSHIGALILFGLRPVGDQPWGLCDHHYYYYYY